MKTGMGKSMDTIKNAVNCGYWHLYRYNPNLKKEGKNPFTFDSKEPKGDFKEFLMDQVRFSSLENTFPDEAKELFLEAEEDSKERYEIYKTLANL